MTSSSPPEMFYQQRTSCLLLLVILLTITHANSERPTIDDNEAYVSLLYGDSYALAVRVMMHSLLKNSPDVSAGHRKRVVIITGETSPEVEEQIRGDGIVVNRIPEILSPYTHDSKYQSRFNLIMTKLYIFNMTEYTRLAFLDGDSLVVGDMSPLFTCGQFCATFINPSYFNAGSMLVTPNQSLFSDMLHKFPTTPSYDGGDQGFLNAYFPDMIDAPLFDADDATRLDRPLPRYARLPFSWHVDHSSYFPTFSFAFSRSDRCGTPRNIEWLGPPVAKPWLWWTYAVLDLSWKWNSYRGQLSQQYPPKLHTRRNGVLLILSSYLLVFILACFLTSKLPIMTVLTWRTRSVYEFDDALIVYFGVIGGILLWAVGVFVSILVVPQMLTPFFATVVFVHVRVALSLLSMVMIGCLVCVGHARERRSKEKGIATVIGRMQEKQLFAQMLACAIFDACYLVLWTGVVWKFSFTTMWSKAIVICAVLASQLVLTVGFISMTCLAWLDISDTLQ